MNIFKKIALLKTLKQLGKQPEEAILTITEDLKNYSGLLGKAGLTTIKERSNFKNVCIWLYVILLFISTLIIFLFNIKNILLLILIISYFYCSLVFYYLKQRARKVEQENIFQLTIFLESLILLVEAGQGVLPALKSALSNQTKDCLIYRLLKLGYKLCENGITFSKSLETISKLSNCSVFRHALIHLDLSNSQGAALAPTLRSLSDYTYNEWKHSVEYRVKRLENLVVFPVFTAVIGLMILSSSVPIVPLIEFKNKIIEQQQILIGENKLVLPLAEQ